MLIGNPRGRSPGPAHPRILSSAYHTPLVIVRRDIAGFLSPAGGVAQLLLQIRPLLALDMLPVPRLDWRDPGVRRVLRAMAPAVLGVSAGQITILMNTQLAAALGDGRISWITYADRLMEFPTAMLGVALGTVLLPSLSRHHADADRSASPASTERRDLTNVLGRRAQDLGRRLANEMSALVQSKRIDVVASPAIGGLIIGYEVARALGARFIFAEREGVLKIIFLHDPRRTQATS